MNRRPFPHPLISLIVILLLAAACSAPVSEGMVDVGGYDLYIKCTGKGSPTVVMEAGFGEDTTAWDPVIHSSSAEIPTRVCVYDRAGVGMSEAPPRTLRTSLDIAHDLHTLLDNANTPGPYVLVGWSMAGYTAVLYADQYPEQVGGMVLVDASTPTYMETVLALLAPETPDEPQAITNMRVLLESTRDGDPLEMNEYWDYVGSAELVSAVDTLGDIPLVVLTQDLYDLDLQLAKYDDGFPAELAQQIAQELLAMHQAYADLSTQGTLVVVEGSGHNIPADRPDAVAQAIVSLVEDVRGE